MMIFRQLFDAVSCTYSYLIGDKKTGQAVLIDSVIGKTDDYLMLLEQLQLKLVVAMDTHTHADHITALGSLRDKTGCRTMLGEQAVASCVTGNFSHGDIIDVGELHIKVLHTPGHTNDSYSFYLRDGKLPMLFTGDTLLIRGTGRTDFQNGDAGQQYHSLFDVLLKYPDHALVYPGHDYKGWTVSTVAEERAHNPRLQVADEPAYVELMGNLHLPQPDLMDVAVPANQACGIIHG
jgi:sulfur dioxygenase